MAWFQNKYGFQRTTDKTFVRNKLLGNYLFTVFVERYNYLGLCPQNLNRR